MFHYVKLYLYTNMNTQNKIRNWTTEEIETLIKIYPSSSIDEIRKVFPNKTPHAIHEFARKRGLKKTQQCPRNRKGDLSILLNNSFQSFYWFGYLMADGYINHKTGQLVLMADSLDKEHMKKFANYVKSSARELRCSPHKFRKVESQMYRVAVQQPDVVSKLISLINFKPQKTYHPPEVEKLKMVLNTREKFLSFLLGFIDGDGSIVKTGSSIVLKVENHASWIFVHNFFIERMKRPVQSSKYLYF